MNFIGQEDRFDNVLSLPDIPELRTRLQEKLDEYNSRIEKYKKKYQVKKLGIVLDRDSNMLDAIYKSEIAASLLNSGKADIREIYDSLRNEFNEYISEDMFANAISVISDYINTGGKHTYGGSGFFTDKMFKELLEASAALEYPDSEKQRAVLQEKYYEYVGRNVIYQEKADTTADHAAMKRNGYKMKILSRLQEKHRLFVDELAKTLKEEEGKGFDKMEFYNALRQLQELLSTIRQANLS